MENVSFQCELENLDLFDYPNESLLSKPTFLHLLGKDKSWTLIPSQTSIFQTHSQKYFWKESKRPHIVCTYFNWFGPLNFNIFFHCLKSVHPPCMPLGSDLAQHFIKCISWLHSINDINISLCENDLYMDFLSPFPYDGAIISTTFNQGPGNWPVFFFSFNILLSFCLLLQTLVHVKQALLN